MNNYKVYLLVFARILGAFVYNPLLSRKNVPTTVKIGTSVALSLVIGLPLVKTVTVSIESTPLLAVAFLKEGFVGVILGVITNMFISTILVGGESMDLQSGLGMAKIYDASNGVQMSLFGSVMTYMFIIYFFITNCHLTYIKIFAISYQFIPVGFDAINPDVLKSVVLYFGEVLILAMKLALPIVASQLILEICVGILMKAVPQIQVMQVNIQVKMLFGLFLLFIICQPMTDLIQRYMDIMINNLISVLPAIST